MINTIHRLVTSASAAVFATAAVADPLEIGAALPAVSQKNQDDQLVDFSDGAKKTGYLFVYFYPKADTPGCTKQACSLRDAYAKLTEIGVSVYGVSSDKVAEQKVFKAKYKLPFDLLADHDKSVILAFGVPTTLGFSSRQAFLFKDGKLVWRDLSASTAEQAADVLKFLKAD